MAILTRQTLETVPPRQFVAYAPEGQMIGVKDKIWFLREGLFAKYVISLVGLVVFVLAVNGAMETWISYRATRTSLTDAMSEKAEATARRIEQSMSELERQISWVTRASSTKLDAAGKVDIATT